MLPNQDHLLNSNFDLNDMEEQVLVRKSLKSNKRIISEERPMKLLEQKKRKELFVNNY